MKAYTKWCVVPLTLGLLAGGPLFAADQDRDQDRMMDQTGDQDRLMDRDRLYNENTVYGWQLMSQQERSEYRNQMMQLRTERERNEYSLEHHKLMQERAKARGVKLKDVPMRKMDGTGPGNGMGPGMGMGNGPGGGGGGGGR